MHLAVETAIDVRDLIASYIAVSGRAFTFHQLLQDTGTFEKFLMITVWLSIFFTIVPTIVRKPNFKNHKQWIACALLVVGIFGSITNGENKLCDLPLIVFAAWFLTEREDQVCKTIIASSSSCRRVLVFLICFIIGLGFGEAVVRHRVFSIGPFFDCQISEEPISGSFFKGFHGSPLFAKVHNELAALLFCLDKNQSIWFGPRMQWAYADFNVNSPLEQPIWWHPGVSYSPSQEEYFVNAWKDKHFDMLVFFHNDTTYLPQELITAIKENYFLVSNQGLLTILHRKP